MPGVLAAVAPRKSPAQSGQALIIAVLVMLVLLGLAGLFIALLVSQTSQTARQADLSALAQIAEAGLNHADDQLANSPEGADWRPPGEPFTDLNGDGHWDVGEPFADLDYSGVRDAYGVYDYGDGFYRLSVTYNPRGDPDPTRINPYSRFIRIESTAQLYIQRPEPFTDLNGDGRWDVGEPFTDLNGNGKWDSGQVNPFLQRSIVGFKPVGLTDYLRFVTNRDGLSSAAHLGLELKVMDSAAATVLEGPVRVQSDLVWHGPIRLKLRTSDPSDSQRLRMDQVEVAGKISHAAADPPDSGLSAHVNLSLDDATPVAVFASDDPQFTTHGGRYRDGVQAFDAQRYPRWVRSVPAPAIDSSRYLELTRNSGVMKKDYSQGGAFYNTGYYPETGTDATGETPAGIFIDNSSDIQFSHNLEKLRDNLLGKTTESWDYPRMRTYTPPGAEIELHSGDTDGDGLPDMTIVRHDAGWYQPDFVDDEQNEPRARVGTITVPYPRNGVVYALGNVRARGCLPQRAGDPAGQGYKDDANRYYHLTIVSGGSIYIEGNVVGPRTAGLIQPPSDLQGDELEQYMEERNSKLALLARDFAVLNTTQIRGPRPVQWEMIAQSEAGGEGAAPYEVRPGTSFEAWYSFPGTPPSGVQLLLQHAAAPVTAPGHLPGAIMQLFINDRPFDWSVGGTRLVRAPGPPISLPADAPDSRYLYFFLPGADPGIANESDRMAPLVEALPDGPPSSALKPMVVDPYLLADAGAVQRFRFEVPYYSPGNYWLYDLALQASNLEVIVEALIYAERGSWFVIPGAYFSSEEYFRGLSLDQRRALILAGFPDPGEPFTDANGNGQYDPDELYTDVNGNNQYDPPEPLDLKITVRGAISENFPASITDAGEWTAKWRGPNDAWDTASGTSPRGLSYVFDSSLAMPLFPPASDVPPPPLRCPALPASPGLIRVGERI